MAYITTSRRRSTCTTCGSSRRTPSSAARLAFVDAHRHTVTPWAPAVDARRARGPWHGWPTWAIGASAAAVAILAVVL